MTEALLQVVHGQRSLGRGGLVIGEAHASGLSRLLSHFPERHP